MKVKAPERDDTSCTVIPWTQILTEQTDRVSETGGLVLLGLSTALICLRLRNVLTFILPCGPNTPVMLRERGKIKGFTDVSDCSIHHLIFMVIRSVADIGERHFQLDGSLSCFSSIRLVLQKFRELF